MFIRITIRDTKKALKLMEFQQLLALASRKQSKHDEQIRKIDEQKRLKQEEHRQHLEISKQLYSKKVPLNVSIKTGVSIKQENEDGSNNGALRAEAPKTNDSPANTTKVKSNIKPNGLPRETESRTTTTKDKFEKDKHLEIKKNNENDKKPIQKRKELSFNEILELAKKNVPQNIGEKRPFEDLIPCPLDSKYRKADRIHVPSENKREIEMRKYELPSKSGVEDKTTRMKTSSKPEMVSNSKHSNSTKGIIEKAVGKIENGIIKNSNCDRARISQIRQEKYHNSSSNICNKNLKEQLSMRKNQSNSLVVSKNKCSSEGRNGISNQPGSRSISLPHGKNVTDDNRQQMLPKSNDRSRCASLNSNKTPASMSTKNENSVFKKPVTNKPLDNHGVNQKKNAILAQLSDGKVSSKSHPSASKLDETIVSNRKLCPVPIRSTPPTHPAIVNKENRVTKSEPKPTHSSRTVLSNTPSHEPKKAVPAVSGRGIAAQLGLHLAARAPPKDDYDTYSSDGDYESDDSFIDDSEAPQGKDYAYVVRDIHRALNFDPRKYKEVNPYDDLRSMEANYREIEKEERRSARLAAMEDNEELVRDMLRKKKKILAKKHQGL